MKDRRIIENGKIIDNRDLESTKTTKINDYREQTNYNILVIEGIDQTTQINAALGIYDEERLLEIKSKIEFWRNRFLTAKSRILTANTLAELDDILL
jgi:hypothetical protein